MEKLIAFIALSAVIIYISRASLFKPRSHGFFRFFAWEAILALFLLNVQAWFREPFAWNQLVAWFLLIACLVPLVFGVRSLVARGKPTRQREGEPNLLAFEKTSQLVTAGIYRYIRHPLYSSLLLLTWGIFFKLPSWVGLVLASVASGFLYATALADEAECIRYFGEEYKAYMQRSKRFLPFLF